MTEHAFILILRKAPIISLKRQSPAAEGVVASLLGRNEPGLWYEAATVLAPLGTEAAAAGSVGPDRMQELQQQGEAALENEARLFDRDMSMTPH